MKVFAQNLQLYGLSPESASHLIRSESKVKLQPVQSTYVAVDVAKDGLSVGISCHIDCRLTGSEPPS